MNGPRPASLVPRGVERRLRSIRSGSPTSPPRLPSQLAVVLVYRSSFATRRVRPWCDPSAHDDSLGASDFLRSDRAPNRQSRWPSNSGPRNRGQSRARPTENGSRDDSPSTTESSPATLPTVSDCGEIRDGTWMQSKRDRRPILFSLRKYNSAGRARRTERRASLALLRCLLPTCSMKMTSYCFKGVSANCVILV